MSLKRWISDAGLHYFLNRQKFLPAKVDGVSKAVGIIFSGESLVHQQLAKGFAQDVKTRYDSPVYLFGYIHRRLESKVTFAFPHFSLSDCGIVPNFDKHKLSIFMQRKYEVLINLDLENYKILHYVACRVQARQKLGIAPQYKSLYSIIVDRDPGDTPESLFAKTLDIFGKTAAV